MFRSICNAIDWPLWAKYDERYKSLDVLDRWLSGTFYDHLPYGFHQETDGTEQYIPIHHRRPSVKYNLPLQVAKRIARKLFAGRQAPRLVHDDPKLVQAIMGLEKEGFLDQRIMKAVVWGSVGSVAMTFKIIPDQAKTPRIVFDVHRSKYCKPTFDALGELQVLRVQYVAPGIDFLSSGVKKDVRGDEILRGRKYWFVRDYEQNAEVTYLPVPSEWDPNDPNKQGPDWLLQDDNLSVQHDLGFVPGHWFVNFSDGDQVDGNCTWLPAVDTAIEIDYELSQLGRGLKYNSCPTPVFKGKLLNYVDEDNRTIVRGPAHVLHFDADRKDMAGNSISGGDAKLLEMTGSGLKEGREYVELLRRYALEQISASRKDPDKMKGSSMSGKAMEILDEDFLDLVGELRTCYGDQGLLPLLRKASRAAAIKGHPAFSGVNVDKVDSLEAQWPKPYAPSAQEFVNFANGLLELCKPVGVADLAKPTGPSEGDSPAVKPVETPEGEPPLLTRDEARALLEGYIDLPHVGPSSVGQQKPVSESEKPQPTGGE